MVDIEQFFVEAIREARHRDIMRYDRPINSLSAEMCARIDAEYDKFASDAVLARKYPMHRKSKHKK